MDWTSIVGAAAVGGAFGLLGGLLGSRFKRDDKKYGQRVALIAAAIGAAVGPQVVAMPAVQQARLERDMREQARAMFDSERVAEVYAREGAKLFSSQRARDWMQHPPKLEEGELGIELSNDSQRAGAVLAARGMTRLDDASLSQFFDVKGAMADGSDVVCAGFWSGNITQADVLGALRKLPEEQKLIYARAILSAMARELEASAPPPRVSGRAVGESLQEIADSLAPAARDEFQNTLAAGEQAPPSAGCSAFKLVVKESRRQTPPARADLIRALSFPTLVDPDQ